MSARQGRNCIRDSTRPAPVSCRTRVAKPSSLLRRRLSTTGPGSFRTCWDLETCPRRTRCTCSVAKWRCVRGNGLGSVNGLLWKTSEMGVRRSGPAKLSMRRINHRWQCLVLPVQFLFNLMKNFHCSQSLSKRTIWLSFLLNSRKKLSIY